MKHLTYHRADADELQLALHLLDAAARNLQAKGVDQWGYWMDPPAYKMKWLKEGFDKGYYHFIKQDQKVIAMYRLSEVDLEYWGPQEVSAWYVHSLVVHPNRAGLGLGQEIMKKIESEARDAGIPYLRLDCHAGNARLCQYYEDLSFEKVGEKLMPHSLNNLYQKDLT